MFSAPNENEILIIAMILFFAVVAYGYGYYQGRYSSETINAISNDTVENLIENGFLRHHDYFNDETGKYDSIIMKYDALDDDDFDRKLNYSNTKI